MFLTATNIVNHLVGRGLVDPDSVVDGDFVVTEMECRNRIFRVMRGEKKGLFVKQIKTTTPQTLVTLKRESSCYRVAWSDPRFASLARVMPRFYDYDPARYALVLELLLGSENLTEHHLRLKAFPTEIGQAIGEVLGICHSGKGRQFAEQMDLSVFPRYLPWILSVHILNTAMFDQLSRANADLIELVRQYPEFMRILDGVKGLWQRDGLLHGDIKWENFIRYDKSNGKPGFCLIDWEISDFGDTAWDVGALFQAYLDFWILSMPVQEKIQPEQFVGGAGYDLVAMQPAVRQFWETYIAVREPRIESSRAFLNKSMQYCAALNCGFGEPETFARLLGAQSFQRIGS